PVAHEKIRGKGSHAPATANILKLKEAGFNVSLITAFSTLNLDDFDDIFQFCLQHGFDWQIQMTSAKGRCSSRITLTPDEYYTLGEKTAALYAQKLPINIIPMDDLATFSHFAPLNRLSETWQGMCTGGLLNLFVRANGDVTPCSALAFPQCIVGNIRKDSLRDICLEERCKHNLSWLDSASRKGVCAECPFLDQCQGGCPEILLSMCEDPAENLYCYHRIEQERILKDLV
ncbi:SPASM domain-containing protein, partial [Myxococcota bacterium]|nr:SPASM domain-containing protein [Myxococcota bacterium]